MCNRSHHLTSFPLPQHSDELSLSIRPNGSELVFSDSGNETFFADGAENYHEPSDDETESEARLLLGDYSVNYNTDSFEVEYYFDEECEPVTVCNHITLEPKESVIFRVSCNLSDSDGSRCALLTPMQFEVNEEEHIVPRACLNISGQMSHMMMTNISNQLLVIPEGTCIGHCSTLETHKIQELTETHELIGQLASEPDVIIMSTNDKGDENVYETEFGVMCVGKQVNEKQLQLTLKLLRHYQDVFSSKEKPIGQSLFYEQRIDTDGGKPFYAPPQRTSQLKANEIIKHVNKLEEQGVISPIKSSQWNSNVVIVFYPDKKESRFTLDLRGLNKHVKPEPVYIPHIDDVISSFKDMFFVSEMDANSSFHQISLAPEDRHKTSFMTPIGTYAMNRLPMGLKTATAAFSKFMYLILSGLSYKVCLSYVDNVYVFSRDFESHLESLSLVLARLRYANLTIKASKCQFMKSSIRCLGHIVDAKGSSPDPNKVKAILNMPRPQTVREVAMFVNMVGFYRKHLPHLAELAKPLTDLLKEDSLTKWQAEHEFALEAVKQEIASERHLVHFDRSRKTFVKTDASKKGLSGIIEEECEDGRRPVVFTSRVTSAKEENFFAYKLELLSVIHTFKKNLQMLISIHFTLITDNHSLCYLMSQKTVLKGQLARWFVFLSQFDFDIQHIDGKKHIDCDMLSRFPDHQELADSLEEEVDGVVLAIFSESAFDLGTEQHKDKDLRDIITKVETRSKLKAHDARAVKSYIVTNDILKKQVIVNGNQTFVSVLPKHLIGEIFITLHDMLEVILVSSKH